MTRYIKLTGTQMTDVRNGKTLYLPRRKYNSDDGSWWVVAKVQVDGFTYIPRRFASKRDAEKAAREYEISQPIE